jgi:putative ABC transport system permease protein
MTALLSITLNLTRLVPNPSTGQTGNISTLISYFKNADATLFNGFLRDWFAFKPIAGDILLLLIIVAVVKILMDMFFRTKTGFMIKATGNNEQFVVSMAKAPGFYKIIGLCIANAAVALGGAVYSQQLSYFDNSAGVGMVVIALASVIIGTSIFARVKKVKGTTASVIGAVIYSFFLSLAVFVGIDSTYLKLLMAALFAAVLIINYYSGKKRKRVNGGRIGSDIRRR